MNYQLTDLGATFVKEAKTAPLYRLYSMGPRPLLVRQAKPVDEASSNGNSINLEVWSMPIENVG
jgi:allophanate hydrolase